MNAHIISIGDELTSGQRLDTNSQWLSQQLADIGVRVVLHSTVADDLPAMIATFEAAVSGAELVLVTGGLGPTADDLTREAIAQVADVPLELDDPSLDHIRKLFASHGRTMPERNEVQAYIPHGGSPLANDHGTAPGIAITIQRGDHSARLYAMPGVPAEMYVMFEAVRDEITAAMPGRRVIIHRAIKCFGQGESAVEAMLPDIIRRGREPTVGITVSKATITLRISAHADDEDTCRALIEPTERTIRDCLGDLVFGTGEDELQDAVIAMLRERGQTLAVAEWGTRGLVTHWLHTADSRDDATDRVLGYTVVADGADSFARDISAPADEHDPTTDAGLEALAESLRKTHDADYALVIGPLVPGSEQPTDDGEDNSKARTQPPRIPCAVAHAGGVATRRPHFAGPPDMRLERCAKHALDLVRHCLLGTTN